MAGFDNRNGLIGYACIVVGELFIGAQFTFEEKLYKTYSMSTLKMTGCSGFFGLVIMLVCLFVFYFVKIGEWMVGLGAGPENRLEDVVDALIQISNSPNWLLVLCPSYILFSGAHVYARLNVTNKISATTAAVLSNVRIIFVWAFFLIPFGPFLCRVEKEFHYTAVIALVLIVVGVFLYHGVNKYAPVAPDETDECIAMNHTSDIKILA